MKKIVLIISTVFIFILTLILTIDYAILAKVNKELIVKSTSAINLDSSLFTKVDSQEEVVQDPIDFEADGFVKDYENEKIIFYTNTSSGAFRVYMKSNGYTWASDVLDYQKYDLNNVGVRQVQSAFTLLYRDENNNIKTVLAKESNVKLTKKKEGNKIIFEAKESKSGISFKYQFTIDGNKVNFLFDYNSIVEDKCRLTTLTFFPYLGSAYQEEMPGYALLPSGSGALIRFDQKPTISTAYSSAFYGEDANITINNEGDLLSLPVYGIVHGVNQNGMFVEIKDGATFAKLNYSPSSTDKGFHMVYPSFAYRETYQLNFSSNSILMIPADYYHNNIEMNYTFLSGDDSNYSGMAKAYQETLVKDGILKENDTKSSNIPLDLEVFGKDYENGLILKKNYKMSKTHDILSFDSYLKEEGIDNIFYMLRAFNRGGYSNQSVSNYHFDSSLGSLNDLKDLEYYFYYNPVESYNSSKKFPSKVLVNLFNEKNFIKVGVDKYKFYANVKSVEKYTLKALNHYDSIGLDGIGYRLYGDNNNNLSKTDSMHLIIDLLANRSLVMYTPNYYVLQNTSKYLNMPLYSERLRFYTDSVPFLEMVLKGYIEYFSPYLNFSSNETMDVLKCIEYGCYPAYLVTKEESYLLADTLSSNYYATTFDKCKGSIVTNYQMINSALKQVIGAKIISRDTLALGVYLVNYSNGKKIIVNYTDAAFTYQGKTITSLGYEVI